MEGFDPRDRELCPDGSCIGLIGPDGRCKVCGTISPSTVADPRRQGMLPGADDEEEIEEYDGCIDDDCDGEIGDDGRCMVCGLVAEPDRPPISADDDFDARQLCSDDACTGLIGIDGRCKECGKPAETAKT